MMVLLAAALFAAGSTAFLLSDGHADTSKLSYQCFKTQEGWGYDIMTGKKIIIHQPFVPGVAGNAGFQQEQQAAGVAQIVIEKIKSGQLPIINHQQLQRLNVLHTQVK